MTDDVARLKRQLERARNARLEAERLLEAKSDELYESFLRTQSSEALLQSALINMTDGLLLTDQNHRVILTNDQMGALYPDCADLFQENRCLQGHFSEMLGHPEYQAALQTQGRNRFFEITLDDGRVISVGISVTPENWISTSHRDVTTVKHSEQERRNLLFDLMAAQRLESLGRMSGMIAHDFNNIVAAIKGYAEFLHQDIGGETGLREPVNRIMTAASRAETMIQEILNYSEERNAPRHPVSLVPVLEDCIHLAEPDLNRQADFIFDPPVKPLWVLGDESKLGRLFTNLITNAARALPSSNARLTLTIETFDSFDSLDIATVAKPFEGASSEDLCYNRTGTKYFDIPCVRVTLTDNGSGIDLKTMRRIFEMYFSTRKSGRTGGVGMASVAEIALDFGGCVRVSSVPGEGTAVEVLFPVHQPRTPRKLPEIGAAFGNDANACDVLIIDDDEAVGSMLKKALEREGIRANFESNPEVAVEQLIRQPEICRVILCDQIMPEMKGSEVHQRIREAGINTPFLLCSAKVDPVDREFCQQLGDRYISKPIDQLALLALTRRYL